MLQRAGPPEAMLVRYADACAAGFVVSNDLERAALGRHQPRKPVEVVPHFIEQRVSLIGKGEAKAHLGFTDLRVVTLLGFIHPRKGHDLALSVLERLPSDSLLVFAGAPVDGASPFFEGLMRRSEEMGLKNRLRVTGYLNEAALDLHLSATDVAICPFREVSASGSVATWFAAGKPIVATDLPLFRMYRQEFGDGVQLATRGDADAFARLVLNASLASGALEAHIRETAGHYSIGKTATRMADALSRIVDADRGR
jgi:glycosyltransferase involved in cell wall biosynthesis